MAPGAPRSKRKPVRGKGKSFSRNLRPLEDEPDIPESAVDAQSSGSNESSEEENVDDNNGGTSETMSREERKAVAKAKKDAARARLAGNGGQSNSEDDDDEAATTSLTSAKGRGGISVRNPNDPSNSSEGLSRREREALEAAAAKDRYWKLQEAGKTDQAKADLARLALIRQEREEKARQRKAEMDEKKAAAELKAAQRGGKKR